MSRNITRLAMVLSLVSLLMLRLPTSVAQRGKGALQLAIQKSLQQTESRLAIEGRRRENEVLVVAAARVVRLDDLGFTAYSVDIIGNKNQPG